MTVEVEGLAAVGDVLAGKYRVDKILGIGGMGMVVAATHLEIDQRVALKFMLPASDTPDTSARFLREARAAGRLNSDHVCRVMDVGRFDSGAPYIVMEYLQGYSFAALLRKRGPLRVSEAVDYLLQAIEGIAEAHAHGIIHRDLKPDNLFLHKRNDGGAIVKVLDFGISKAAALDASTKTGDIMGSPAYMAPEQMESSRNVDQRADVWSLGVVAYQMVVGKAPFQADTLPLLCLAVVNDEPPPMSAVREDLPDGFEAVVMKCLRKDPVERFADVGELAEALAPFGPRNATTSASRIQIVLRRIRVDSAAVISHEFATVEPTSEHDRRGTLLERREPARPAAAAPAAPSLPPETMRRGRSRGLIGALIGGIVVVALAIAIVARGRSDSAAAPEPRERPQLAAPIVEPIIEPTPVPPSEPTPTVQPTAPSTGNAALPPPTAEPVAPAPSTPPPSAASTAEPSPPPERAPKVDHRKRKPNRPPAGRARTGAGSGSAAARGSGADAGSDEDDKWMHMTHDEKKP